MAKTALVTVPVPLPTATPGCADAMLAGECCLSLPLGAGCWSLGRDIPPP